MGGEIVYTLCKQILLFTQVKSLVSKAYNAR